MILQVNVTDMLLVQNILVILVSFSYLISAEQQNEYEVYQKLQQDLESMKFENGKLSYDPK